MSPRLIGAATAALALPLIAVLPAVTATAAPPTTTRAAAPAAPSAPGPSDDVREAPNDPDLRFEDKVAPKQYTPRRSARSKTLAAAATPPVGTVRRWLARDDTTGSAYLKPYTLRGVGDKIEVWVANDTSFPAGDCRNQVAGTTDVTDQQVADLIMQFDTNIYPTETSAFSTPPDRDGTHPILGSEYGDFTGDGDKTVTLVDNVRDDNYYDFPERPTYIAGFFSSSFNEYVDRNVMTIDAYDWAHRTGTDPADQPTDDLCTSRPSRPRLYEGTFAHEWQHLLQYYTDPAESIWLNEGLSDLAQTLVGYVDATKTIDQLGNDSHINCFLGWGTVQTPANTNPRDCGGPENSLNLWGESPNPNAVLADYGNAYAFLLYLYDRYGLDFISQLHRDGDHQGLASVEHELAGEGAELYRVLHRFQSAVLLDRIVDTRRGVVLGARKADVTTKSLNATVNLANPASYATPGAAPNGADYVLLQDKQGRPLKGAQLHRLSFRGATTLPAIPLAWSVVSDDPDRPGNPVLFSGNADNLDVSAIAHVSVPTADPTLRFLAKYGAEAGYDYAYVVVSTDGGATYTPIAGDKTVEGPLGPALNGTTDGFEPHTFDLSAYAGQDVLLGVRYVTDGGVSEGGVHLDDVTVGGTVVSDGSSLAPFDSITEIRPTAVSNWNVKLVGIDEAGHAALQAEVNGRATIDVKKLPLLAFTPFRKVVAIVAYDDPTESVNQYAPYALTVNGVLQPGGR